MIKKFTNLLFLTYLIVLFYLLFFSSYRSSVQGVVDYNLIPFKSIIRDLQNNVEFTVSLITNNLFGNVFAFLPLGFLLPVISNKIDSYMKIIVFSGGFSFFVECTQLTLKLGTFDVDDIILNTFGGLVGYWLMRIAKMVINK